MCESVSLLIVVYLVLLQSNSEAGTSPVSQVVQDQLTAIGEQLMGTEVDLYEKGIHITFRSMCDLV